MGVTFVFTLLVLVAFGARAGNAPPFAGRVALPAAACLSVVVLGWTAVRLSSAVTWLHGLADATNR